MRLFRSLHADAHVRTAGVVEVHELGNLALRVLQVLETAGLHIDALGLYGGVHALCQGVVRRLVVLRHADGDTVFLKLSDVHVATVLHAAVGMVDEPLEVVLARLRYGHAERVQSEQGTERGGHPPAYYLARIGVGHQVEVTAPFIRVDVGDIAHPQPVRARREVPFHEVFPLVVAVVGACRMAAPERRAEQLVPAQDSKERVASGHPFPTEHVAEHQPQLVAADARIDAADLLHGLHHAGLFAEPFATVRFQLVIGLSAMAKQPASGLDVQAFPLAESRYCLAPDFFRIRMPCSSAMSIIVVRARF